MPCGQYAQEKLRKHEERLIGRLKQLDLDLTLVEVIKRQAKYMLTGAV